MFLFVHEASSATGTRCSCGIARTGSSRKWQSGCKGKRKVQVNMYGLKHLTVASDLQYCVTMGKLLGAWATVKSGSQRSRRKSWPRHSENIYLRFQFWTPVQVVQSSPQSNAFSVTNGITINFLEVWRHPHAKLFADYNTPFHSLILLRVILTGFFQHSSRNVSVED
jgi:hypothetical protein